MPRFICTKDNITGGVYYSSGSVIEAAVNPNTSFFASYGDDVLRSISGGFQRDLDGTLYLPSGGWDDLTYPASGINPLGAASDPGVSATDGLLEFSASAVNIIAGVAHLPHRRQMGTFVVPHVHWHPADATAGNVVWLFEYKVSLIDENVPASYTTETVVAAAPGAQRHILTSFSKVAVPDTDLGTVILWRLSRLGNNAGDTYANVARMIEFDLHFWQDSVGSGTEYSK